MPTLMPRATSMPTFLRWNIFLRIIVWYAQHTFNYHFFLLFFSNKQIILRLKDPQVRATFACLMISMYTAIDTHESIGDKIIALFCDGLTVYLSPGTRRKEGRVPA